MKEKVEVELVEGWDSAYLETFETGADFGCVLFKNRNEAAE
ncbi:hypothetical protein [Bacillus swezeyi]|nr:hypothetical protein [Bacillus swezeyi]